MLFFLCNFSSFFSYVGGIPVTNHFLLFNWLIGSYILAIQQIITHKEHLRYSLWSVAIFWTSSEALAPWSKQQKVVKTASKSFSPSSPSKSNHFSLFWCMLCTATPDISSSSKNINSTARVFRLSFRFLWLWYYTTIERLRSYINDARLFYPWITHTIEFIIYLFMIATFPLKEE